jgi:hypothetical protein
MRRLTLNDPLGAAVTLVPCAAIVPLRTILQVQVCRTR